MRRWAAAKAAVLPLKAVSLVNPFPLALPKAKPPRVPNTVNVAATVVVIAVATVAEIAAPVVIAAATVDPLVTERR